MFIYMWKMDYIYAWLRSVCVSSYSMTFHLHSLCNILAFKAQPQNINLQFRYFQTLMTSFLFSHNAHWDTENTIMLLWNAVKSHPSFPWGSFLIRVGMDGCILAQPQWHGQDVRRQRHQVDRHGLYNLQQAEIVEVNHSKQLYLFTEPYAT